LSKINSDLREWKPILDNHMPISNHPSLHAVLVVDLDDIAWILNLRALDIDHVPVFYSYLWISNNEKVLFVDENRPYFHLIRDYLGELDIKIMK